MRIIKSEEVEWSLIGEFFSWLNKESDDWTSETKQNEGMWTSSKLSTSSYESTALLARRPHFVTKGTPTNCAVCDQAARCCHYSVAACTGCKSFFRRSIVKNMKYMCVRNNQCDIKRGDKCRKCRLVACLREGMDARAIQLSKASDINAMGVRRKRELEEQDDEIVVVVPRKVVPRFDQTNDSRVVDVLSYLEMKLQRLRESAFTGDEFYELDIREVLCSQSELGRVDKYEEMGPRSPSFDIKNWPILDLLLNVEHLKVMPFFYDLTIGDQEALVMHVALVNCTLMRSFYSHQCHSTTMVFPDGVKPLMYRKSTVIAEKYPEPHRLELDSFCRTIEVISRVDPEREEYILLKAMIFCHSEAPGLSDYAQKQLEKYRNVYSTALLRRMQARRGTVEGARKYAELVGLIETYFHFAQRKREFHILLKGLGIHLGNDSKLLNWFVFNSSRFD
ncbi:hypothetical protein M3Y94_00674600 [Aphelenchoides besseyi]|nr:hypothetical protein M3Y94_00674600 [Aphelenchoides besseyi]KAI6231375.1 hypothetical protein M3Y95_00374800 [Aphelenchoides besseyi]